MQEFILLMHPDVTDKNLSADPNRWESYMTALNKTGQFDGGSTIGAGACFRKQTGETTATSPVCGFIRVRAIDLHDAQQFLVGNPVYEAGGTVEIRALPRD